MAVRLCFFFSGAAALVLQVLWARMLGHVLGATALAVATVLTVFMGGLAWGSHLGGRWAGRLKHPFRVFALLEAAVGLYGLLVPLLLEGLVPVQAAWVAAWQDAPPPLASSLFRFTGAALVLLAPTVAMGATLPVLAEGCVRSRGDAARQVGALYAANTFGAVAGTLAAGFLLIPGLGVDASVRVAAGLDLAVAAFVGFGHRWLRAPAARAPRPDEILRGHLDPAPAPPGAAPWAMATYAFTGAVSMALEVLWTRALGVVVGSSTYSFSLILAAYLTGLAAGSALMSRFLPPREHVMRVLAAAVSLAGVWSFVASTYADRLPLWLRAVASDPQVSQWSLFQTCFLFTLVLTLPSTLAFGAVMPLAMDLLCRERDHGVGRSVGQAYLFNTLGAICGSFGGGFVLLPVVGVQQGILLLALCLVVWAAILGGWAHGRSGARWLHGGLASAAAVAFFTLPPWDVDRWTAGFFRMHLAQSVFKSGWESQAEILYHRDGVATSVTVDRMHGSKTITLKVNGKVDASDRGDMPTQVLSGLFPILLKPQSQDVLVIGYGSGVTPGAVLQAPVAQVVVAEVEARVYEAAHGFFGHVNHRPDRDPRADLRVDDGRNLLLTRAQTYDVVISEPSNPWMSGAASLFTADFFQIVKKRLRPEGIFLQWVQLYELSADNVDLLLRTFRSVFPHVMVLTPGTNSTDVFLLGSRQSLAFRHSDLVEALEHPRLGPELARAGIRGPEDFVSLVVGLEAELDAHVSPGPLNTDDNARLEFRAPLDLLTYARKDPVIPLVRAARGRRLELARRAIRGLPTHGEALLRQGMAFLRHGNTQDAEQAAQAAREQGADADRLLRIIRYVEGVDEETVLVATSTTRRDPLYVRAAHALVEGRDAQAMAWVEQDPIGFHHKSGAHQFLYAFLCYRNDRHFDADYLFERLLEDDRFVAQHPQVLYYAGRNKLFRGDLEEGIELLGRFELAQASESEPAL